MVGRTHGEWVAKDILLAQRLAHAEQKFDALKPRRQGNLLAFTLKNDDRVLFQIRSVAQLTATFYDEKLSIEAFGNGDVDIFTRFYVRIEQRYGRHRLNRAFHVFQFVQQNAAAYPLSIFEFWHFITRCVEGFCCYQTVFFGVVDPYL